METIDSFWHTNYNIEYTLEFNMGISIRKYKWPVWEPICHDVVKAMDIVLTNEIYKH